MTLSAATKHKGRLKLRWKGNVDEDVNKLGNHAWDRAPSNTDEDNDGYWTILSIKLKLELKSHSNKASTEGDNIKLWFREKFSCCICISSGLLYTSASDPE